MDKKNPNWKLILQAVAAVGGSGTPMEVLAQVRREKPDFNEKNLYQDLATISVNSPSRTSYGQNSRPRRTDEGSPYDCLFKVGARRGVTFEIYDPLEHGVWEIYPNAAAKTKSGMSIRQISSPAAQRVREAEEIGEKDKLFDAENVEDARSRVFGSIVRRRGQLQFRRMLLDAYGGACAITGCSVTAILEAAHIHPYRGDQTNVVSNGLLLRSDIHTLFDLGLVAIDSNTSQVWISQELAGSEYEKLEGVRLREPSSPTQKPSASALDWHRSRSGWVEQ
jgi:hypothetical protein